MALRKFGRTSPVPTQGPQIEGAWPGYEVVILASGPSLTPGDVNTVRRWRSKSKRRRVMVTNTTYQAAPWADVLVMHDARWWQRWRADVLATFHGAKISKEPVLDDSVRCMAHVQGYANSGGFAGSLAMLAGAARILYLGLDCKPADDGRRHWHGAHPPGLGDAVSMPVWAEEIKLLADHARIDGVEIVNFSPNTALT